MAESRIPVELILKNLAEEAEKVQQRVHQAENILLGPLDTEIATTPYDVVFAEDRVKLKHYQPTVPPAKRIETPLLVVYALINRETMLDLQPGRSVVQNLLNEGIDVYMIDWGYPTRKDRYLTIADHVNGYINNAVDFIRRTHSMPKINLMGICMGGSFSVMYSALHPDKIKNLITTVTPTNFDTDKGLLHRWMKNIDPDRLVDAYGNLPGDVMNLGFLLLNPARLMIDKYVGFLENVDDKTFVENFIRMEKWIFDSPDVPGETFRQFARDCYHKNLLIQSKLELEGRRVDLKRITMPLLNIYGQYDHLVPPEACELLTKRVGSKDVEDMCLPTGHIGIYVSSKCQRELAPKIARWLKEREEATAKQVQEKVQPTKKTATTAAAKRRVASTPSKQKRAQKEKARAS